MMLRAWMILAAACVVVPPVEAPMVVEVSPLPRTRDETIHGDTRHDTHERILWETACLRFARLTRHRARCAIVWDYDEERLLRLADRPHIVRMPSYAPQVGGEFLSLTFVHRVPIGPELRIVPGACPEFLACALHELGHFFSLSDLEEEGSVMSWRNPSARFSAADLEECRRVGLCER